MMEADFPTPLILIKNKKSMPTYKHKETGELKVFSRTRTYINNDGTKYEFDVTSGENLTESWDFISPDGNYDSVATKKSPTDGLGFR